MPAHACKCMKAINSNGSGDIHRRNNAGSSSSNQNACTKTSHLASEDKRKKFVVIGLDILLYSSDEVHIMFCDQINNTFVSFPLLSRFSMYRMLSHLCTLYYVGQRLKLCSQGDPAEWISLIRLRFCSTAVDPPLTSWPKYQVSTFHCFFVVQSFIFHFLHCYIVSLVKVGVLMLSATVQLAAGLRMVRETEFNSQWGDILITISVMASTHVTFHLFFNLLHLFSLVLHSLSLCRLPA
jgi:hypothetical protein